MNLPVISSLPILSLSASLCVFGVASAAVPPDRQSGGASGLITGVTGTPTRGPATGAPRVLSLGDTVPRAEELRTSVDESVEILWDRHAVIQVQSKSTIMIQETKPGETQIHLTGGSVRVALAYGSRPSDIVTVYTPTSRVFTRGGIVEVDVLPSTPSLLSRVSAVFARSESSTSPSPLEAVRVLEGQSGIEPLKGPSPSQMLEAGLQARIAAGKVEQIFELPAPSGQGVGLAATDRRQATPKPLTQNIVRVHVNHALEVERMMSASAPSLDEAAKAAGTDVKGTIVATSLGVPTTSFAQAQAGTGGTSSPGPVTSPLPTLPPIQIPTAATLAPTQSGGNNSQNIRNILNQVFGDERGKGRNKERGKD